MTRRQEDPSAFVVEIFIEIEHSVCCFRPRSSCTGMIAGHLLPVPIVLMAVGLEDTKAKPWKGRQSGSYIFVPIDKNRVDRQIRAKAGNILLMGRIGDLERHAQSLCYGL